VSTSFEDVYRLALQLPPDEQQQLAAYLVNPPPPLTADEIIGRLESHVAELRELGAKKIGLFGSYARDEADPASDIDILVIMAGESYSLLEVIGLKLYLEELLSHPVDVVPEDSLRPEIRPHVMSEAIYAKGV
jgi:predicted nucleotidyltransferase